MWQSSHFPSALSVHRPDSDRTDTSSIRETYHLAAALSFHPLTSHVYHIFNNVYTPSVSWTIITHWWHYFFILLFWRKHYRFSIPDQIHYVVSTLPDEKTICRAIIFHELSEIMTRFYRHRLVSCKTLILNLPRFATLFFSEILSAGCSVLSHVPPSCSIVSQPCPIYFCFINF